MTRIFIGLCIVVCAPLLSVYILRHRLAGPPAPAPSAGSRPRAPAPAPGGGGPSRAGPRDGSVPSPPSRPDGGANGDGAPEFGPGQPHAVSELSASLCPPTMALVVGRTCASVQLRCEEGPGDAPCQRFDDAPRCRGARRRLAFCIDQYEYPNVEGALPAMMLSFEQAEAACEHEDKRLCTEEEWSLACEGPSHAPYSYGFALQPGRCNAGPRPTRVPVEKLWEPRTRAALVGQLDGRQPSGSAPCVSEYGVSDLLGNVREWVRVAPEGRTPGGLKGGDFTSGAATCRPVRRVGRSHYSAFGVGVRCCAEPLAPIPL